MCISPIKIKSPKLKAGTFIQGVDPCELVVPCGHCPECAKKRVRDLAFRAYHEYLDTEIHHGFTLWNTLTYSPQTIPSMQGFYFFRKKDVQKFLKRLRINLQRYHTSTVNFKYLVVAEYGENYRRPHYHIIFFVVGNIEPAIFDKFVKLSWCYLDERKKDSEGRFKSIVRLSIGRTDQSDVSQRLLTSIEAIHYVCKYIFKGSETWKTICYYPFSYMYKYFMDYIESKELDKQDIQDWQIRPAWSTLQHYDERFKEIQIFPFYLQSKNLGMAFLETCCYDDLFDTFNLPNAKSPLGFVPCTIPNYYIRKVFYDYDKETKRYKINSLGIEYKKHMNNKTFHDYLHSAEMADYNIQEQIDKILNGRKYSTFAKYMVLLHNRTCPPPLLWLFDELNEDNLDSFLSVYEEECMQSWLDDNPSWCYNDPAILFNKEVVHKYEVGNFKLFNNYELFKDFDKIIDIITKVKQSYNNANAESIKESMRKFHNYRMAKNLEDENNVYVY